MNGGGQGGILLYLIVAGARCFFLSTLCQPNSRRSVSCITGRKSPSRLRSCDKRRRQHCRKNDVVWTVIITAWMIIRIIIHEPSLLDVLALTTYIPHYVTWIYLIISIR